MPLLDTARLQQGLGLGKSTGLGTLDPNTSIQTAPDILNISPEQRQKWEEALVSGIGPGLGLGGTIGKAAVGQTAFWRNFWSTIQKAGFGDLIKQAAKAPEEFIAHLAPSLGHLAGATEKYLPKMTFAKEFLDKMSTQAQLGLFLHELGHGLTLKQLPQAIKDALPEIQQSLSPRSKAILLNKELTPVANRPMESLGYFLEEVGNATGTAKKTIEQQKILDLFESKVRAALREVK